MLIDLWAKCERPRAVYSDLTRVAFVGKEVPAKYQEIFAIVAAARDAAIAKVQRRLRGQAGAAGLGGRSAAAERDREGRLRRVLLSIAPAIRSARKSHGNGANMDNLETHEERRVLPRTCFSVEPGIYLPEFGVRSEVNVFVDANGGVHVTGGEPQTSVLALLA